MNTTTTTIRITEATIVAGAHAEPGTIHTVPSAEAALIIGAGRAVPHTAPTTEQATATPVSEQAVAPRQRAARSKLQDPKS